MIWQVMMAILYSNMQLRTESDGDTEKGCQKPAVQQKTTELNTRKSIRPIVYYSDLHS